MIRGRWRLKDEQMVRIDDESLHRITRLCVTFQAEWALQGAWVRKPLLAVSGVIDKGIIVIFDGIGILLSAGRGVGVASVRHGVRGVPGRSPLHAKNGLFVLQTWEPAESSSMDFRRRRDPRKGRTPSRVSLEQP